MKDKQKYALQGFYSGKNCAQSVIIAYANEFGMDTTQVMNISSAFGGGMGKLQQTCGAVTGSYMLIGMYNAEKIKDEAELKVANPIMVQEFNKRFIRINGTDQCADLLKVDLKTEDGRETFERKELKDKVCSRCVTSAIEILEGLFSN